MSAAQEFAGDHEAVVLAACVGVGGGGKQTPVLRVDFDHGFTEVIDFLGAAQAIESVDREFEILADEGRIILRIQSELAQTVVSDLEVAVVVGLGELGALLRDTGRAGGEPPDPD